MGVTVLPFSPYGYTPTEYVCIIFVVLFSISTLLHTGQAITYRLWWLFPSAIFAGAIEVVGWAGRLWSSIAPHQVHPFEIQLITTLCGPTPLAAANFTILGGIITRLGPQYSRLGPRRYTTIFLCCDILALFVQGIGGGIAAHAVTTSKSPKTGSHIMLLGIILQLVTIAVYVLCAAEFLYRYMHDLPLAKHAGFASTRGALTPRMRVLLYGMSFNTLCLLTRAVYRVVELADGFKGRIEQTEVYFNVLDGLMIVLAIITLNFTHPGFLMYGVSPARHVEIELGVGSSKGTEAEKP
ncbi:RTA1 like protein-domain-containing protein [Mycena amicta]|nr:RTA1 like protein-domain-containing protein [Mycena amicta]